eukprot:NODE_18_length_47517_cov_0.674814.p14 type:complete len:307 gc:universal NODE_18_length_47517_cov_0.674814:39907-40827(+)
MCRKKFKPDNTYSIDFSKIIGSKCDMPFCGDLLDVIDYINQEQSVRLKMSTKDHQLGCFFGAPGTGKSRLVYEVANYCLEVGYGVGVFTFDRGNSLLQKEIEDVEKSLALRLMHSMEFSDKDWKDFFAENCDRDISLKKSINNICENQLGTTQNRDLTFVLGIDKIDSIFDKDFGKKYLLEVIKNELTPLICRPFNNIQLICIFSGTMGNEISQITRNSSFFLAEFTPRLLDDQDKKKIWEKMIEKNPEILGTLESNPQLQTLFSEIGGNARSFENFISECLTHSRLPIEDWPSDEIRKKLLRIIK